MAETARKLEEDPDVKQFRLMRQLKEKLVGKMNMVPKNGKGKYNVTVPDPPRFLKHKHKVSIRQQRNEQDAYEKEMREKRENSITFKANNIPRTTT